MLLPVPHNEPHAIDRAIDVAKRLVLEQEARVTHFRAGGPERAAAEGLLAALRTSLTLGQRCRLAANTRNPARSSDARAVAEARRADEAHAVREDERKRIAQELHDDLGHHLSVLELTAHRVERLADEGEAGPGRPLGAAIRDLQAQIESSLACVKRLTRQLRPLALETLGFPAAIEWLTAEFANRSDVRVACRLRLDALEIEEPAATALFRIVQEALTNVARHASAKTVTIDLFRDGERCVLRIADDGVGVASNARQLLHSTGMGLSGIADRVAQLRGTLSIHSALGSGFSIVARLPVDTLARL